MALFLTGLLLAPCVSSALAAQPARVLVVNADADPKAYEWGSLRKKARSKLDGYDVKFYPGYDLYQVGRKELDRAVPPTEQRARVTREEIDAVSAEVDRAAAVQWRDLSEDEWAAKADALRKLEKRLWFIGRKELREPLFRLYLEIGRAADGSNRELYPYYKRAGDPEMNWYWFLAAVLLNADPSLGDGLDPQYTAELAPLVKRLQEGSFPMLQLSFRLGEEWSSSAFDKEFTVYVNGLPRKVDENGIVRVPTGRVDLYLNRSDGYSLSDRVELALEAGVYEVRVVANTRSQALAVILDSADSCVAGIDADMANNLAIYERLHPDSAVFVTSGKGKVVWQYDDGKLVRHSDECSK